MQQCKIRAQDKVLLSVRVAIWQLMLGSYLTYLLRWILELLYIMKLAYMNKTKHVVQVFKYTSILLQ